MLDRIVNLLGEKDARHLLDHTCTGIVKDRLHLPGPDHLDTVIGALHEATVRSLTVSRPGLDDLFLSAYSGNDP